MPPCNRRPHTLLVAAVAALLAAVPAAAELECPEMDRAQAKNSVHDVKIYFEEGAPGGVGNASIEAFRKTAIAAMERWNAQSNSGFLRYMGYQHGPKLKTGEDAQPSCADPGGYSLIFPDPGQGADDAGRATAGPTCNGSRFYIRIPAFDGGGNLKTIVTEPDASVSSDLLATLMHEIGHGLKVHHPWGETLDPQQWCKRVSGRLPIGARCSGSPCTCRDGTVCKGGVCTPRQAVLGGPLSGHLRRSLYEYDAYCVRKQSGARTASVYSRRFSDGRFADVSRKISGSWRVAQAGVTRYRHDEQWQWGVALSRLSTGKPDQEISWLPDLEARGAVRVSADQPETVYGLTPMVWRERDESVVRLAYVDGRDLVRHAGLRPFRPGEPYDDGVPFGVLVSHSADEFKRDYNTGPLQFCNSMHATSRTDKLICNSGRSRVLSTHKLGYTWHSGIGATVFAWQENHREAALGRIKIAIGAVDDTTLSQPDTIPASSFVAPAIACLPGKLNGGRDCLLAFVNAENDTFDVRVFRFAIRAGSDRWKIDKVNPLPPRGATIFGRQTSRGETVQVPANTAADIALWVHGGRFWLAFKSMEPGQGLYVWSTNDPVAVIWRYEAMLPYSAIGPSVVAHAVNDNMMVTVEPD